MAMSQPGILAPVPLHSRYLEFTVIDGADLGAAMRALGSLPIDDDLVVGIGPVLADQLGFDIKGLHLFPYITNDQCEIPSTQADLWCWLRGSDRGRLTLAAHSLVQNLKSVFVCARVVDGFKFDRGLDLTGYEDGTENPEGDDAIEAALVNGQGQGLDGSSFVAVQQWVHDLGHFKSLPQHAQDNIIGRRLSDNEEFDDAPQSAHVKRAAQESFTPEAFVVRRSMPWADATREGLVFVAFANSLAPFEAILTRMTGQEDGILDGLFKFTHPITGSYFWCPPVLDGRLDLRGFEID